MHLLGRHTTLSVSGLAAATRRDASASCPDYFAHAHRAVYPLRDVLTGSILFRHTTLSVVQHCRSIDKIITDILKLFKVTIKLSNAFHLLKEKKI